MKVVVLHGEHTLASYERLQKYLNVVRKKNWEVKTIDSVNDNFREILLGEGLFDKQRLIVIKEAKLLNKQNLDWLKNNSDRITANVIIYYKGVILQRTLKLLPKVEKIEEFKLTKILWSFLDSFFPGNAKNAYKLLHESIKNDPPEFIFAMLARQVRDIYWAKTDFKSMKYPSWRVGKLKSLAQKYEKEKLAELIDELTQADLKAKTSQGDLTDSLDFIIAKYLE